MQPELAKSIASMKAANDFLRGLPPQIVDLSQLPLADQQTWIQLVTTADADFAAAQEKFADYEGTDDFYFKLLFINFKQLALFSQTDLGAARDVARDIVWTLDEIEKKFAGEAVAARKAEFDFIRKRCEIIIKWPGPASAKPPDWSQVTKGFFWEWPPRSTPWPWWVWGLIAVGTVVGIATIAGYVSKPSQPTGAAP